MSAPAHHAALAAAAASTTPRDWRATQTAFTPAPEVGPQPPLRYEGGTLGFDEHDPAVYCGTPGGKIVTTDIQTVLRNVDQFAEPDRSRILYIAGMHYGLDPWAMVNPARQQTAEGRNDG